MGDIGLDHELQIRYAHKYSRPSLPHEIKLASSLSYEVQLSRPLPTKNTSRPILRMCLLCFVGGRGLEPLTLRTSSECSTN